MSDLTHLIDLASLDFNHFTDFLATLPAQQPHPSDIGIIKPQGGFSILPAIFGLIALVQISQFVYYGINDPTDS